MWTTARAAHDELKLVYLAQLMQFNTVPIPAGSWDFYTSEGIKWTVYLKFHVSIILV
jgi:hypothetical protein